MTEHSDVIHFRELLPFLVNGTLTGPDRVFIDNYLAANPEASREQAFLQSCRHALQSEPNTAPDDAVLARLLHEIHAARGTTQPSWRSRLQRWTGDWGLTPAFALAATLAVVQSVVLLTLPETAPTQFRGSTPAQALRPDLRLNVKPHIDFASLATLLRDNGGRIVDGPSEQGELWIVVDDKTRIAEVRQHLMQSGLVDDVSPAGTPVPSQSKP